MKFFAVASTLIVAVASEAQVIAPYANYGYGAPLTALNAGYINAAPIAAASYAPVAATYAAAPAVATVAAPAVATYAAAPAVATAPVAAPVATYAAAPVAAPTVASSQFQAQDENGNIAYGYQNINSAKQESGNTYGGVTGSYTYADEAGVHTVNYVADALGFRATGNNLPVAPVHNAVAPIHDAVAPVPVVDTPEVVEARAAFFKAYDAAKSGIAKRSAQLIAAPAAVYGGLVAHPNGAIVPVDEPAVAQAKADFAAAGGVVAPSAYAYAAPVAATYAAAPAIAAPVAATYAAAPAIAAPVAATYAAAPAIAAPVAATYAAAPAVAAPVAATYAAAPVRDAVLTTIKLNPGHATFYRVD